MRVIAMAYGDVPLDRVATGERNNLVYVVAPSAANAGSYPPLFGVGFPREAVFPFDQKIFESLPVGVAGRRR